MANIVIQRTNDRINVNFGHYWRGSETPYASPDVNAEVSSYRRLYIGRVWKEYDNVYVFMEGEVRDWKLGIVQGSDNFVIDTIDGIAPTDSDNLYEMLSALMQ